jgi:hypothetical protein
MKAPTNSTSGLVKWRQVRRSSTESHRGDEWQHKKGVDNAEGLGTASGLWALPRLDRI